MELTEQQRIDLINAGWIPPEQKSCITAKEMAIDFFLKSSDTTISFGLTKYEMRPSGHPGTKIFLAGGSEFSYTAEEYNAALERYKA